jgi:hypothetical protein
MWLYRSEPQMCGSETVFGNVRVGSKSAATLRLKNQEGFLAAASLACAYPHVCAGVQHSR